MKFFDGWSPKKDLVVFEALRLEEVSYNATSMCIWVCLDKTGQDTVLSMEQ